MAAAGAGFGDNAGDVLPVEPPVDEQDLLDSRADDIEKKLDETYRTIVQLDNEIRHLKSLYERTVANGDHDLLDYINLQLSISRAARTMHIDNANAQVDELNRIIAQMFEELWHEDHSEGEGLRR
ncbi:hypothetical protein HPB48_009569 [Haemaphysalis longicornis]|uniref:Uncharacterized protein n=1 Tax=Haemaphysalis longicornis TaxID=44386 RepID=A0A9J6FAK9_HAELO|nr:hypothetical protein HPB48_009569 [Haemaphysalis longicornis]